MRTALARTLIALLVALGMTTAATAEQRYALATVRGASGLQAEFYHWRLDTFTGALSRHLSIPRRASNVPSLIPLAYCSPPAMP